MSRMHSLDQLQDIHVAVLLVYLKSYDPDNHPKLAVQISLSISLGVARKKGVGFQRMQSFVDRLTEDYCATRRRETRICRQKCH